MLTPSHNRSRIEPLSALDRVLDLALRHIYASWCVNRTKDGGLGLPPKNVQERLGHSSITITLDTYGHLFKGDDAEEIDAAEQTLLSRSATQTRHKRINT